ncbi:hypothetical protein SAMN05444422_11548 [Halobiforma haloterrestris]|uniref:Amphi-Trp domain-containing protein n=1 Tax=Natronobacterium haloterrestre TaxID=148448 RepID=A0A1I1LAC7_NATHA|nr:hypothetical protein [Halobiforma haloterrestris]SFC69925.1 hypothetical protein SAMN05444422_11548 [Halobiforma haloterrestris]
MSADSNTGDPSFEDELETVILTAFARGDAIEGQWDIEVPVSSAPDWTITVEKRLSEADSPHEPTFLDD